VRLKNCQRKPGKYKAPSPKLHLRRQIAIWSGRLLGPIMIAGLVCCGGNGETRERTGEPIQISKRSKISISDHLKARDLCFKRVDDSDFSPPLDFGRGLGQDKMLREMIDSSIALYKARPKGSERETPEAYIEYFNNARYSNGQLMYPGVPDVLRTSRNFADKNQKRLAGRRVAISLRPRRFPIAYRLLHTMPHTAVTLVGMVNKSRGHMDVEHAEDIASLFSTLIGFQNRMKAETKLCDFRPNMNREQLNTLDIYYSELIWNWNDNVSEEEQETWKSRDVYGMNRMEWICRHLKHEVENGNHGKFGLMHLPEGFEISYCIKREKEKRPEREHYGRYGPFGVEGRETKEKNE